MISIGYSTKEVQRLLIMLTAKTPISDLSHRFMNVYY